MDLARRISRSIDFFHICIVSDVVCVPAVLELPGALT